MLADGIAVDNLVLQVLSVCLSDYADISYLVVIFSPRLKDLDMNLVFFAPLRAHFKPRFARAIWAKSILIYTQIS